MPSTPRTLLRDRLLAAALAVACAAVLVWAAGRADAAWAYFAARTLAARAEDGGPGARADRARAQQYLDRARARFSDHPDYRDLAGRIAERSTLAPDIDGATRRARLETALRDYRAALAVRPRWPYTWANVLGAADRLGRVDATFREALRQAAVTGPWEPRVQLQLMRSGLRHWDALTGADRALVRDVTDRALRVQPREAAAIAQFYVRPDLVCGQTGRQPALNAWCARFD